MRRLGLTVSVVLATAVVLLAGLEVAVASSDAGAVRYQNCKSLNKRWAHGVGKWGARDRTSGAPPVTNFKRSNVLYRQNKGLDRDKDFVACEKK